MKIKMITIFYENFGDIIKLQCIAQNIDTPVLYIYIKGVCRNCQSFISEVKNNNCTPVQCHRFDI